jgi:5'-deoxynucleotidase YfbR-like HD superfamily hydrolase
MPTSLRPCWPKLLVVASSDVRRLSYVTRYQSIPVSVFENTAEHLFWTVLYAMMIHREMEGPRNLDAPLMLHALTHDMADCLGAELVRVFKYAIPELPATIRKAEQAVLAKMDRRILDLSQEPVEQNNGYGWYIKAVVKAADFLSVYEYVWREKCRGNKEIQPFFERMRADMNTMSSNMLDMPVKKPPPRFRKYMQMLSQLYHEMCMANFRQELTAS